MSSQTGRIVDGEKGLLERMLERIGIKPDDPIERIVNDPGSVSKVFLAPIAIASSRAYEEAKTAERTQEQFYYLGVARRLTDYLYRNMGGKKNVGRRKFSCQNTRALQWP